MDTVEQKEVAEDKPPVSALGARPAIERVGGALDRLIGYFSTAGGAVAAASVLAMVLLVTANIVMREFFSSLIWVPQVVGYLMVGVVFLALGDTMRAGRHIKIDLITKRFPRRVQDTLEVATLGVAAGLVSFFTWHGTITVLRTQQYGRKDSFGVLLTPLWLPELALPIGLGVLGLVLVAMLARKIYAVARRSGTTVEERQEAEGAASAGGV